MLALPATAQTPAVAFAEARPDETCLPLDVALPRDGALCEAARLGARSLAGDVQDDAALARLMTFFAERQGVADAHLRPLVFRGPHVGHLRAAMEAAAAADREATHHGAALTFRGEEAVGVLLLVRRLASLAAPLPRRLDVPDTRRVRLRPAPGWTAPRAWLGLPDGDVAALPLSEGPAAWEVEVRLTRPGRYVLEVLAQGPEGPEVAFLAPLHAGIAPPDAPAPLPPDEDGADPVARIHAAVAEVRRRAGRDLAERDVGLDAVAARKAEAVARRGRTVHRPSPEADAADALTEAGWAFAWAAEDLAAGPGALAAFTGLLESPAHRRLLLEPRARRLGVGVARARGRTWLALLLAEPMAAPDSAPGAAARRVREAEARHAADVAIGRRRSRAGRAPAVREPELEALAAAHARHLAALDLPEDPLAEAELRERVLAEDPAATDVGVEVVVGGRPEAVVAAPGVTAEGCERLGLGVARARSRRFGGYRLWLVAVCVPDTWR